MDKALDQLLDEIEMSLMKITDEKVKSQIEKELASLRKRFEDGEIGEGIKNDIISLSVSTAMQTSGLRNVPFETKHYEVGPVDERVNRSSYLTYIQAKLKEIDEQRVEERVQGYITIEEAIQKYKIRSQEIGEAIAQSEYQTMMELLKKGYTKEANRLCQIFHSVIY